MPPEKEIGVLSQKARELLRRLAIADHRSEIKELIWLIEQYAAGRLRDLGDNTPASPRVSLTDLPDPVQAVEMVRQPQDPHRLD